MRSLLIAVLATAALAACADIPTDAADGDLDAAWRRWQQAGITDYRFDVQVICFCGDERTSTVTAVVLGGAPVSLVYADSGNAADTLLFTDVRTMGRVFATLRAALDRRPSQVTATYDAALGYPLDVWVDFNAAMADEEIGYRVTNFARLR